MGNLEGEFKNILATLDENFRSNKLLLFSLFAFMNNNLFEKTLHENAIIIIDTGLSKSISKFAKAIVLSSLSMIAFKKYDGNFWDNVFESYYELGLKRSNRQSVENQIRNIIRVSIPDNIETKRIINYVLMQTIVPQKYLFDFINILDVVYKYDLRGHLPEDLHDVDEVIDGIFKQISEKASSNDDYFKSSTLNKSYKLVQTTREVISNNFYRQELIKFSKLILVLLDKRYNNISVDDKNNYLSNLMDAYISKEQTDNDFKVNKEDKFIWKSNIIFEEGELYLETKSLLFDIEKTTGKIYIEILSDGITQKIINNPRIITRDTTSELYSTKVLIDFLPFNLEIVIHGIPTNNQLIKNDYLLFSATTGKKISNIQSVDEILVIYPHNVSLNGTIEDKFTKEFYNLAFINRLENECFGIGNDTCCFDVISKSKLIGDVFPSIYLNYDDKDLDIYKNAPKLLHIKEKSINKVVFLINETRKIISYENYTNDEIIIDLEDIKIGYNEISILDIDLNTISNLKWRFYYDPQVMHEVDETISEVSIKISGYDLHQFEIKAIEPPIKTIKINKFINMHVRHITPRALISEHETVDISEYFWIADMPVYKEIQFIGVNKNNLIVKDSQFNLLTDLIHPSVTNYGKTFKIDISILKVRNLNGQLIFSDEYGEELTIPILSHNAFNKEDISIEVINEEVVLSIDNLLGKNLNTIHIVNEDFDLKVENVNLKEALNFSIPFDFNSYEYCILENEHIIFKGNFFCINEDFLIGQTFKINNVSYYQNYDSNLREADIKNTYLNLVDKISDDRFSGILFYKTLLGENRVMYNIEPVTLLFISKVIDLNNILIDAFFEDKEDESELRLLFNDTRKQIVNSTDETKLKNVNLIEDLSIRWEKKNEK